MRTTYLTRTRISIDALLAEVSSAACGGTCVFLGTVRSGPEEQGVTAIEYSAYEAMVEAEFGRLLARGAHRRAPPSGGDSVGGGEHRHRGGGAAPGRSVRGLPLRDRRGEAARAGLEEG